MCDDFNSTSDYPDVRDPDYAEVIVVDDPPTTEELIEKLTETTQNIASAVTQAYLDREKEDEYMDAATAAANQNIAGGSPPDDPE